jgi:catechol 2,3-dioxygenase-like lactoylglutathione lyase family enzyme
MSQPTATERPAITLKTPIHHIHHVAYRCRDAEQTRWFWEDVLGFPLRMAMVFDDEPGSGRKIDYMHLFFEMGDNNFVAFFDSPDDDINESTFIARHGFDLHIAFECDTLEELKAWRRHINKMGRPCFGPIDHGFIHSIYMYDPNGIQVEITLKDVNYRQICSQKSDVASDVIKEWTEKTRERKIKKFGAEAIDRRGVDMSKVDMSKVKSGEIKAHKASD